MKPPAFDIGYGVYRSFFFTEYVPPPPAKTSQTPKGLDQAQDEEEQSNIPQQLLFIIIKSINQSDDDVTHGWARTQF